MPQSRPDPQAVLPAVAPLFVPGNRPDRFAKAAASGADAVIIDLEDAVADGEKPGARSAMAQGPLPDAPVFVRVNGIGTSWHAEDIEAVIALPIAGIVLPKAELSDAQARLSGRLKGRMALILLIETAKGLSEARALAALAGTSRLAFGSLDFCVDLGIAHTREALAFARMEIVLASRLACLPQPFDGVSTEINDGAVVEADAFHARDFGFGGKLVIHPKQIAPVMRGFAPSRSEIAWARQVLSAGAGGAVAAGGIMIDAPVRLRAERILVLAKRFAADPEGIVGR